MSNVPKYISRLAAGDSTERQFKLLKADIATSGSSWRALVRADYIGSWFANVTRDEFLRTQPACYLLRALIDSINLSCDGPDLPMGDFDHTIQTLPGGTPGFLGPVLILEVKWPRTTEWAI
jgi:hypothetical protein